MPRSAIAVIFWAALSSVAHAFCTPQMVADLQMRGASPMFIAQMCGGVVGGTVPISTVCVTNVGVCPYRGPVNAPCQCVGQMGVFSGISR
jgi:hypothetical protein